MCGDDGALKTVFSFVPPPTFNSNNQQKSSVYSHSVGIIWLFLLLYIYIVTIIVIIDLSGDYFYN